MSPEIPLDFPPIAIVTANALLGDRLKLELQAAGYAPTVVAQANLALTQVDTLAPVAILVDRRLAGDSGLNLCRELRDRGFTVPIVLLMARDEVSDRVACLEAGADDYLLEPIRSESLLSLLGLYFQVNPMAGDRLLRFADLSLDVERRFARRENDTIALTMKEFDLLKYLMEHPGEVLSREQILENVWGYDFMGESNVIEVYVRYLRLKLEDCGRKRLIQTVRGVGYVLREM